MVSTLIPTDHIFLDDDEGAKTHRLQVESSILRLVAILILYLRTFVHIPCDLGHLCQTMRSVLERKQPARKPLQTRNIHRSTDVVSRSGRLVILILVIAGPLLWLVPSLLSAVSSEKFMTERDFVLNMSRRRNLFVSSHGRLLSFDVDRQRAKVIHEGRGVYYGMFSGDADGENVWVVSRPHNWRPKAKQESLLLVNIRSGGVLREVIIPSRFTHDAVRKGGSVYIADTGGGHVLEFNSQDLRRVARSANFTRKEHVNTISPVNGTKHPETLWIVLHNLGPSDLVLLDTSTGDRIKIFRAIGEKVHGFVQWEGHYIYLNSANGQLCKFTPPGCKSDSVPGKNEILWVG